jgi:VWFA-related protein
VPASCQVIVRTGSGAVEVLGVTGSLVVETDSGAITCRLPAGLDADLAVRSLSGAVDVRLPLEAFGPDDPRILDGRIGRGGAPLIVRSRSGSIRLLEEGTAPTESSRQEEAASATPTPKGQATASSPEPASSSGGGFRLRVESRLVNLNVRVTDGTGATVSGLAREDFRVYENDVEQSIAHFQPQTAPLNLFLLLDLSGSTKDKTDVIKQAAIRFIESLDPADRVAVAAFTSRFMRVSEFTNDRRAMRERVKDIRNTGGGTAFYDAAWYSLDELEEVEGGRQVLVIMSVGVDNVLQAPDNYTSKHDFESLLARAASSQATLFPIYLDTEYEQVVKKLNISSLAYKTARRQLAQLADGTGGTLFRAERVQDLEGVYRKVVAELRTLYSLSYYAPPAAGGGRQWRAVRVQVAKPGATAGTRPGYYSQ